MSQKKSSTVRLVLAIILAVAATWLFVNRQYVIDQLAAWQYQPSSEVMAIAETTTMTDQGRFLFYASKPSIEPAESFNNLCGSKEPNVVTLGCYTNYRIYVYDVENQQLKGIKAVTAAHELLHATYQRLDSDEQKRINKLVETEYKKLKDDPRFAERMAVYAKTEPGERANELHSIIGTEVAEVGPELEEHYAQYFSDRQEIVQLHNSYASVFEQLRQRTEALEEELAKLRAEITSAREQYQMSRDNLNDDIATFNQRADNGDFGSRAEFNQARAALVERAEQLSQQRAEINATTARYNQKIETYNKLAVKANSLYESINSKLEPSPSL